MIQVIHDSLKVVHIPGYDMRLPDRILSFIEKAGMLPPSVKKGRYYSREIADYIDDIENEWEKE